MGYYRADFDVVGVDIKPQPRYPFPFVQGDALEYCAAHGAEFDVIHASPPCQAYSLGASRWNNEYVDLLGLTEETLLATGKPFVIENVDRAPFTLPTITLCGIQFGLNVIRHRRFGSNILLFGMHHVASHPVRGEFVTCAGHGGNGSNSKHVWAEAMAIDWMTKTELSQAIPPAYTEYIGTQLLQALNHEHETR